MTPTNESLIRERDFYRSKLEGLEKSHLNYSSKYIKRIKGKYKRNTRA